MIKALQLCNRLFKAISDQKWDDANKLVEELAIVLRTYKDAC